MNKNAKIKTNISDAELALCAPELLESLCELVAVTHHVYDVFEELRLTSDNNFKNPLANKKIQAIADRANDILRKSTGHDD